MLFQTKPKQVQATRWMGSADNNPLVRSITHRWATAADHPSIVAQPLEGDTALRVEIGTLVVVNLDIIVQETPIEAGNWIVQDQYGDYSVWSEEGFHASFDPVNAVQEITPLPAPTPLPQVDPAQNVSVTLESGVTANAAIGGAGDVATTMENAPTANDQPPADTTVNPAP